MYSVVLLVDAVEIIVVLCLHVFLYHLTTFANQLLQYNVRHSKQILTFPIQVLIHRERKI